MGWEDEGGSLDGLIAGTRGRTRTHPLLAGAAAGRPEGGDAERVSEWKGEERPTERTMDVWMEGIVEKERLLLLLL